MLNKEGSPEMSDERARTKASRRNGAKKEGGTSAGDTGATVGCEAQLWQMADALRGSMDAAESPW